MIDLESLGITKEELTERVIDKLVSQLLEEPAWDEDGEESGTRQTSFQRKIAKAIEKRIDDAVNAIADKHIAPNVQQMIEGMTLQQTNQWGEKRGEKLTFIEYLVQRANGYMSEEVNHHGKTRAEDNYNWSRHTTRLSYLINDCLHYHIKNAMEAAVGTANESVRKSLEQAVKIALAGIQVKVETKVQS